MSPVHADFACGDVTLEGELHLPEGTAPFPGVIVCHPHPLYGGDMQSGVVAICEALPQCSIAALRFNFRGVGRSGGAFGGGVAEQADIRAALDFILTRPDIDANQIGLAGYSFGANVALAVALQEERFGRLALVSPALSDAGWEQLKSYSKSKLLIVGEADSVIRQERLQQYIRDVADREQYRVVPGADHFWWGYEEEVADKVARFFAGGFNPS